MTKGQATVLDFSLLPIVDSCSVFKTLPNDLAERLRRLPETLSRAQGASIFAGEAAFDSGPLETDDKARSIESHLRAGLGEFVSIEDVLAADLKAAGLAANAPHRIDSSQNPLLHLCKLLRNINFHVSTTSLTPANGSLLYAGENVPVTKWCIFDLTTDRLLKKREVQRKYQRAHLDAMVDWFNDEQPTFGVGHLVRLAVEIYANEILKAHPE